MAEHWRYLKILDDDFRNLSRFVEPSKVNLSSYSLELARLLMIAAQECDVLLQSICVGLGDTKASNEQDYRATITDKLPSFQSVQVEVDPFGLVFQPFEDWSKNSTPVWWTANNKIKHDRVSHFEKASLSNVLLAISGVLVANLYLHRDGQRFSQVVYPLDHFRPLLRVASASTLMKRTFEVLD